MIGRAHADPNPDCLAVAAKAGQQYSMGLSRTNSQFLHGGEYPFLAHHLFLHRWKTSSRSRNLTSTLVTEGEYAQRHKPGKNLDHQHAFS